MHRQTGLHQRAALLLAHHIRLGSAFSAITAAPARILTFISRRICMRAPGTNARATVRRRTLDICTIAHWARRTWRFLTCALFKVVHCACTFCTHLIPHGTSRAARRLHSTRFGAPQPHGLVSAAGTAYAYRLLILDPRLALDVIDGGGVVIMGTVGASFLSRIHPGAALVISTVPRLPHSMLHRQIAVEEHTRIVCEQEVEALRL
ncbi:hypothetical protein B0H14DRAFT_3441601 [Mycena olivaceomarginata]|nr:hypothetical protein B0H14DRAFT_3441601 [Mycena olivaceomarginata]